MSRWVSLYQRARANRRRTHPGSGGTPGDRLVDRSNRKARSRRASSACASATGPRGRAPSGLGSVLGHPLCWPRRGSSSTPIRTRRGCRRRGSSTPSRPGPDHSIPEATGVAALARAVGVLPAKALLFDRGALGSGSTLASGSAAPWVLREGVPTGDQREGLLVVIAIRRDVADVDGRSQRIRIAVGAFGIDARARRSGPSAPPQRIFQIDACPAQRLVPQPSRSRGPSRRRPRAPTRRRGRRRSRVS